jgi:hypothetical protein
MLLNDHAFGDAEEDRLQEPVVRLVRELRQAQGVRGLGGGDVQRTSPYRYADWDFEDEDCHAVVELKSRRCSAGTHPTTLLSATKVSRAQRLLRQQPGTLVLFVFNFTDCVLYCCFETIEQLDSAMYRGTDGYYHIPVAKLTAVPGANGHAVQRRQITDFFKRS